MENLYRFKNFLLGLIQPFLISIYPVCMVMAASSDFIYFGEFLIYISILFFAVIVLYLVLGLIYKDWLKSSLFLSIAIIFFYGYRFFADMFLVPIAGFTEKYFFKFRVRYFLVLGIILLVVLFFKFFKLKKIHPIASKFLILPLLAIYFFLGFQIVNKMKILNSQISKWQIETEKFREDNFKNIALTQKSDLPDIYYIILDMFISQNSLKNYFNLDLSCFFEKLKDMGFYVANNSYSNYTGTYLSFSGTFSLDYISSSSSALAMHSIMHNNILYFLNSLGYKYFHVPSESLSTCNACRWQKKFSLKDYFSYCLRRMFISFGFVSNVLGRWSFLDYLWMDFEVGRRRRAVLEQFENLKSMTEKESPKFVFAHIMSPHRPYMFDKNGNYIFVDDVSGYPGQVQFVSKKIYKILDQILKNSHKKPIIVLQADHGISSFGMLLRENFNGIENLPHLVPLAFSILNAYYFPDGNYSNLYDSISPVNTFRLIFNKYFGTKFAMLGDHSFMTPKDTGFICVDEFK